MCGEADLYFGQLGTLDNGSFGFIGTPITSTDESYELSTVVDSIDQSKGPSDSSTAQSSMTLPFLGNVEESTDENCFLKQIASPLPVLHSALDVAPTDFMSCFESPMTENGAEGSSYMSPKSTPGNEAVSVFQAATNMAATKEGNTYTKRRSGTISDICGQNVDRKDARNGNGTKRKPNSARGKSSKRQKKATQSSKFCHICVRSKEQVLLIPCSNVVTSICRKAVCQRCFLKHGMMAEWDSAVKNKSIIKQFHEGVIDTLPNNAWTCPHCQNSCPSSAQCKIYAKTNRKRHLMLQKRRMEREMHLRRRHVANKDTRAPERTNAYNLPGISELPQLPLAVSTALPEHSDMISTMLSLPSLKLNIPHDG